MKKNSVFIIIPVHNRKATTLTCLERLQQNGELARYSVVVVDDGSEDGTADAIATDYPEVTVLQGDGNLWWTGAITKGMEYAYEQGANFFIWLNDDTLPEPATIATLVEACQQQPQTLVAAQCLSNTEPHIPSYGGQQRHFLALKPSHAAPYETLQCDALDGNLVC